MAETQLMPAGLFRTDPFGLNFIRFCNTHCAIFKNNNCSFAFAVQRRVSPFASETMVKLTVTALLVLALHASSVTAQDFTSCAKPNTWAMTFDDGPNGNITPGVLDALKNLGVKATFFVQGSSAAANPNLVKRAYNEGHQISQHTYTHPHLPQLSTSQIQSEVKRTEDLIYSLVGVHTVLIRPPFGETNANVQNVLHGMGYTSINWNLDSQDWNNQDPYNAFNQQLQPGKGYISLQHDAQPVETGAKVTQIVNLAKSRGFKLVSIAECIGKQPYKEGYGNVVIGGGNGGPTTTTTTKTTTTTTRTTGPGSPTPPGGGGGGGSCSAKWGQCGGKGWSGPTCCQSGSTCTFSNDYYSQCI
ncbi:hypothetical protein BJ742DRAFT_845715 [Cladochytrium replicatum]|nr:hypothetical protein BJ742DRAFT_845715 [Cladochytrium replicatum]